MPAVAVLGTGRMGGAIARRLKASGFELTLWDRTKEKAERLNVGPVASTPAEAIRGADTQDPTHFLRFRVGHDLPRSWMDLLTEGWQRSLVEPI